MLGVVLGVPLGCGTELGEWPGSTFGSEDETTATSTTTGGTEASGDEQPSTGGGVTPAPTGSTADCGSPSDDSTGPASDCGNDSVEGAEICDGLDLAGATCASEGFWSGALECRPDCTGYQTTGCSMCGNGVIDDGEECDGAALGARTCVSRGLGEGELACAASCELDDSGCGPASGSLLTVRIADQMLRALDPATLAWADIGPLGVPYDFGEISWDATTGTLWMVDGLDGGSLYTVDVATGAATLVGVHGVDDLFGVAFDASTGTLFGSGPLGTGLYTLDQFTGAASWIGGGGLAADGLTYDAFRDQLVGLGSGVTAPLHVIDRSTGSSTVLVVGGTIDNNGLAYDSFRDLYWAIEWSGGLFTYDPNAGYARTLQASGLGAHDGLTYVPGEGPGGGRARHRGFIWNTKVRIPSASFGSVGVMTTY